MYISSVVSKRTANALLKKNIYTTDDFVRFFPKKYYDLTTLYDIQSAPHDIVCAIRGRLISVRMKGEYGKKYIQGEMIDKKTETPVSFFWFGNYYGFRELPKYENMDVVVCGMVAFSEQYGYSVKNPVSLCAETEFTPRIEAVERKISGVSAENYAQVLKTLLTQVTEPYENASRNISMGYKDAVTALHFPKSFEEIQLAKNRLALDDLLYFALRMRETETVSGQDCLDVQKKTDGSVNIIGEVATDPVASWMIQSAQVASKFTLFTHHAKTFPDLVTALRNSMLRAGVFKDERTAEEQVVQVLNFDIHLVKDFRGRRYIERVTECIPVEDRNEYTFDYRKEKSLEGKLDKFMDNATVFFTKTTNRELYKYRNIMEYQDGNYVLTNPISEENIKAMRMNMDDSDIQGFDDFLQRNWGIKLQNEEDTNQEEIVQPKKRGRKPKATI